LKSSHLYFETDLDSPLAQCVARAITAYERFRLNLYQQRPGNPNRILIRSFGDALAMRFPAVDYFNQVQGFAIAHLTQLAELDAFYHGIPHGYKIQAAPDTERATVFDQLSVLGFRQSSLTVRMAHRSPCPIDLPWPDGLTIAPVQAGELDEFFLTYLQCFGAVPENWPAALQNMRLLHGHSELHCLYARLHGRPVGVGMVFMTEGVAYLCAGAVLSAYREQGIQALLINERLRLAVACKCQIAASWTEPGGTSHRNLLRAGFEDVYHDPIWLSPAASGEAVTRSDHP
jgi:hypothetical protein